MSKLYMLLTFMALPYYILRAKRLLKCGSESEIYSELKRYGDDYFKLRNKRIKTFDSDNYLNLESCIFVSNHQSHNDIFILLSCLEKPFRFIAKKELFDSIIFKNFMKLSKSYPLDRNDDRASLSILKKAVEDIKVDKASVIVFPEGTRSHSSKMNKFKSGLFSMLRRAKTPIIPVYIHNSYQENDKEYYVYFGEPIVDYGLKGFELSNLAYKSIKNLQKTANSQDL